MAKVIDLSSFSIEQIKEDPLLGFEGDSLKEYIVSKPVQVGDEMILYGGHGHFKKYELVTVEAVDVGRQKRIIISKPCPWGGKSFYRSGINCFAPKGQSHLLPPLPCLKAVMKKDTVMFNFDGVLCGIDD